VKLDDEDDRHSLKMKRVEQLEHMRDSTSSDDSLDEELLRTQNMSELSAIDSEHQEWYTLIGILVLLLTLVGSSLIGVTANVVPASNGFVQLAQRSGVVVLISALPAYLEY
jgi:hypothetical protein